MSQKEGSDGVQTEKTESERKNATESRRYYAVWAWRCCLSWSLVIWRWCAFTCWAKIKNNQRQELITDRETRGVIKKRRDTEQNLPREPWPETIAELDAYKVSLKPLGVEAEEDMEDINGWGGNAAEDVIEDDEADLGKVAYETWYIIGLPDLVPLPLSYKDDDEEEWW